jgi:uncharacterized membrane protein (DUF106 family)
MKRIAAFMLLAASIVAWSIPATAQRASGVEQENERQYQKSAKKQQKRLNKANKKQQKTMKKYEKAQQKAARKANRRHRK